MKPLKIRCSAKSKRSGERCKRWAIRGATVCPMHGGATPQVRNAAARRLALAEALERADRRPVGEVLLDTLHTLDTVFRDAKADLIAGGASVAAIDKLITSAVRAAGLAKTVHEASIEERQTKISEAQGALLAEALRRVLDALDLSPTQRALVPVVVPRELRAIGGGA